MSGQTALGTVRPIDYGKRRFQADFRGNYNPDDAGNDNAERVWGYRASGSYVDQFASAELGELGISIGAQKNIVTNPEQEYRTSSAWGDCRNDPEANAGSTPAATVTVAGAT